MLQAWHIWLIVGFLLALSEILVPGFFLLPFGVAAGITAAVSLTGMGVVWQLTIFVLGGALLVFLTRRFFVRADRSSGEGEAKTNIEALVGKSAVVTQPVAFERRGYVKVGGEEWGAVYPHDDDTVLEVGTRVRLKDLDGIKFIIEPLPKEPLPKERPE